jgi:hypothetical protein
MRSADFFRHLQSTVDQIDGNDLFHPKVFRSHQSCQAHTSQAEDNDTFVLLRLQNIEDRPCTRLETATTSCVYPHLVGLTRKFDNRRFANDAQPRETALAEELTLENFAVGLSFGSRAAVGSGAHEVQHASFARSWMAAGTALASPAVVNGQQDRIADLDALVVDIGANCAHDSSSLVAEDGRWIGETGEQVCLPDEFLLDVNGMRFG